MCLRFERGAIADLELWRLLSAHITHLGWVHLGLNATALLLLALLFERYWLAQDLVVGGVFVAIGTSLALYYIHPAIQWYVGLSGVMHGWFVIASVRMTLAKHRYGWLLLGAISLKIAYELIWGPPTHTQLLGGQVIEEAHLWGALTGLLYVALRVGHQLIGTHRIQAS